MKGQLLLKRYFTAVTTTSAMVAPAKNSEASSKSKHISAQLSSAQISKTVGGPCETFSGKDQKVKVKTDFP